MLLKNKMNLSRYISGPEIISILKHNSLNRDKYTTYSLWVLMYVRHA